MQILPTLAGRGKLAGVVGSAGRAGAQLRARTARTQPRSASQQHNRALIGSLAALWRSLDDVERSQWNAIATGPASGYNTFVACTRNLLTIAAPYQIPTPGPRPTFPPLSGFTATGLYTAPTGQRGLYAWQIDTDPELTAEFGAVLRISQPLSYGRGNIRASELRIVATSQALDTPAYLPGLSWANVWGAGPQFGAVTFELNLVDPLTGFASSRVRCIASYEATSAIGPIPWTNFLQQGGLTIAETTDVFYEQGGVVIAGPNAGEG